MLYFQLMASHQKELELLSEKMDAERTKQQLSLRERLAERRKRKMADLRRKQEAQLTKEMLTQKKEIDEIRTSKAKESAFFRTMMEHFALVELAFRWLKTSLFNTYSWTCIRQSQEASSMEI